MYYLIGKICRIIIINFLKFNQERIKPLPSMSNLREETLASNNSSFSFSLCQKSASDELFLRTSQFMKNQEYIKSVPEASKL